MKKIVQTVLASLSTLWFGCVDGNTAFRIVDNLEPNASCQISATGSTYVGSPSWDLAILNDTYIFNVQVESEMIDRSDELKPNVHDIRVLGWEVQLRDLNGDLLALGVQNPFTVVEGAGFLVRTGSPGAPSRSAAPIVLIPESYRVPLQTLVPANGVHPVYARFRLFGKTIGGISMETPWVSYPITLCLGCLATTCDPDVTIPDGSCLPGQNGDLYCM